MKVKDIQAESRIIHRDERESALNVRLNTSDQEGIARPAGRWSLDLETNIFTPNHAWKEMLGITAASQLTGEFRQDLLHTDDRLRATNELYEFIESNLDQYNQEYRMRHADGKYRYISSRVKALRDRQGRIISVIGTDTDITAHMNTAHALEKSERKYRNLFQNSLVAMGTVKADLTEVIEANEQFWSFTGVEFHEREKFQFYSLLHNRQMREFKRHLDEKNILENYELQVQAPDDAERWVLINAIQYPEEGLIDFVLKDITQTKENLIELQKVNFELDSFVYHASHDLRSPLRSILGLIDLYRMETDPELQEECIEKIQVSVRKLDDLVIELLSISRNDRVNDPFTEINLLQEVNSSIASYYNASDTTNLEIMCKILQPVKFHSDATRIRIILNNIISNAIKYRSFRKEKSTISIEADVSDQQAVITISDNGDGIEESKLPHIFDMFYRATEKSEGSGLGLYIVKKVADKLNASIQVESVELDGTTFTVTIPNGK